MRIRVVGLVALIAFASVWVAGATDRNVVDCGARSDGTKCTTAFASAVDACAKSGGGRVIVPSGTWYTGPVHLKSNVELHLEEGAVVLFSDDPKDCLPVVPSSWEGLECLNLSPLVYANGCTNVALTGKGTLRAKMDFWRRLMDEKMTDIQGARAILYKWGSEDYPVEKRDIVKAHPAVLRPQLIQFNRCRDVRMEGVRVEDSPFWTIHLLLCDGVTIRGIDVCAHGFNNDGVDIEMTQNVLIEDSTFDQGDDGIVFKAGRNRDGWRLGRPTKNVEVRNCRIKRADSLAGIGSELSGGVENVYVHDCTVDYAARLFFVKTNHRRGGHVRNVRVENIVTRPIARLFVLNADVLYQWREMPDYETRLTEIDGLTLRNITCERVDYTGFDIVGDPRLPPTNITLEDIHIGSATGQVSRIANVGILRQNGITCGKREDR